MGWGRWGGRRGLFEVFFHFINRSESRLHSISTASPREGKTEELQSERVQGSTSEEALHHLEPLEPLGRRCRTPGPWFPPCGEHRCAAHSAHCLGRRWTPHLIGRCARSTFANVCRGWIVPRRGPPSSSHSQCSRTVSGPRANRVNDSCRIV